MSNKLEERATVSAQVTAAQRAELERRAHAADRSLSSEIRRALRRHLEHDDGDEKEGTDT